ncbi:unnamed protein product [Cuscuta europaea]|uniref:Uncharacterized protein n=1 Tax=Cuscuta europaea TaxID=41803 RepID=A0A9P0VNN9_CUSEU|nr:unnamed protein product [Cuscuta europaea]
MVMMWCDNCGRSVCTDNSDYRKCCTLCGKVLSEDHFVEEAIVKNDVGQSQLAGSSCVRSMQSQFSPSRAGTLKEGRRGAFASLDAAEDAKSRFSTSDVCPSDVRGKRGASPSHEVQVEKKVKGSLIIKSGREREPNQQKPSSPCAPPASHRALVPSIPSITEVARLADIVPSLVSSDNWEYLAATGFLPIVERSITAHTEGLMRLITALRIVNGKNEELQREVDNA